jgi:FHS family L-fucose permease-like MFS transporter
MSIVSGASPAKMPHNDRIFPAGQMLPFSLVTSLFFMWGVPNNLNDVLIRQFMKSFALTRFEAGLVQSAFYLGYFLLAIPAALLMRRFGYKTGILVGLGLFSLGTFLFWPAANEGKYIYFLIALFVIASGLSFLETAANPFIAQLGDAGSSERRLNFSQAFNPLGSISGVLIGTIFIFSGVELTSQQISSLQAQHLYEAYLRSETLRVVKPYLVLGAVAFLLLFCVPNSLRFRVSTRQARVIMATLENCFDIRTSFSRLSRNSCTWAPRWGRGVTSSNTLRKQLSSMRR